MIQVSGPRCLPPSQVDGQRAKGQRLKIFVFWGQEKLTHSEIVALLSMQDMSLFMVFLYSNKWNRGTRGTERGIALATIFSTVIAMDEVQQQPFPGRHLLKVVARQRRDYPLTSNVAYAELEIGVSAYNVLTFYFTCCCNGSLRILLPLLSTL